jgi:hypothetical protein
VNIPVLWYVSQCNFLFCPELTDYFLFLVNNFIFQLIAYQQEEKSKTKRRQLADKALASVSLKCKTKGETTGR